MRSLRRPRHAPAPDDPAVVDPAPEPALQPALQPAVGPALDGPEGSIADAETVEDVRPPFEALPIPVVTRRRVAFAVGALVSAWIVVLFVRQVGEASAATSRVEAAGEENAALAARVGSLQRELELIQERPYILLAARGHGLGGEKEIPFTLAPDAPPVAADAPGSEGLRLGESSIRRSPLDAWLSLLFGPDSAD
jgi:cell division protein FtsB